MQRNRVKKRDWPAQRTLLIISTGLSHSDSWQLNVSRQPAKLYTFPRVFISLPDYREPYD